MFVAPLAFQFGKEVAVELHIVVIEAKLRLIQYFVLFGWCSVLSEREETTTASAGLLLFSFLVGFQEVGVVGLDGLGYGYSLFLCAIQIHDAEGIAQGLVYFLFLIYQFLENSHVATNTVACTLGYQIIDVWSLFLTIAVDASVSLFQGNQTPRNIVVEHQVAVIMQIDTL